MISVGTSPASASAKPAADRGQKPRQPKVATGFSAMKTCTYISGPPCVGKSTVTMAVQHSVPGIQLVRGDDYWTKFSVLPFEERVAKVNQSILAALRDSASSDVLCEWVPCRGPFVAQLHDICASLNRRFLHVALTAPVPVLKGRKRTRDGDEDVGPDVAPPPREQRGYETLVFDTEKEKISRIADEISDWILSDRLRATVPISCLP
jgi:hypothetical protein